MIKKNISNGFMTINLYKWELNDILLIGKNREVRHQGEAETSQLGWYPTPPPILCRLPNT